jgi:hypothetical protein
LLPLLCCCLCSSNIINHNTTTSTSTIIHYCRFWKLLTVLIFLYRLLLLPYWLRLTGYARYTDWSDLGSKQPAKSAPEAQPLAKVPLTSESSISTVDFGDPQYELFLSKLYMYVPIYIYLRTSMCLSPSPSLTPSLIPSLSPPLSHPPSLSLPLSHTFLPTSIPIQVHHALVSAQPVPWKPSDHRGQQVPR